MTQTIYYPDLDAFRANAKPGSFHIANRAVRGLHELFLFCPCGCGLENHLLVGANFKPGGARSSWRWNGSRNAPTLDPSINMVGHWHGWLRNGVWEVC